MPDTQGASIIVQTSYIYIIPQCYRSRKLGVRIQQYRQILKSSTGRNWLLHLYYSVFKHIIFCYVRLRRRCEFCRTAGFLSNPDGLKPDAFGQCEA